MKEACKMVDCSDLQQLLEAMKQFTRTEEMEEFQIQISAICEKVNRLQTKRDEAKAEALNANRKLSEVMEVIRKIESYIGHPGDVINNAKLFDNTLSATINGSKLVTILVSFGRKMEELLRDMWSLFSGLNPEIGPQPSPLNQVPTLLVETDLIPSIERWGGKPIDVTPTKPISRTIPGSGATTNPQGSSHGVPEEEVPEGEEAEDKGKQEEIPPAETPQPPKYRFDDAPSLLARKSGKSFSFSKETPNLVKPVPPAAPLAEEEEDAESTKEDSSSSPKSEGSDTVEEVEAATPTSSKPTTRSATKSTQSKTVKWPTKASGKGASSKKKPRK